jgi:hypothetical protein
MGTLFRLYKIRFLILAAFALIITASEISHSVKDYDDDDDDDGSNVALLYVSAASLS